MSALKPINLYLSELNNLGRFIIYLFFGITIPYFTFESEEEAKAIDEKNANLIQAKFDALLINAPSLPIALAYGVQHFKDVCL